jgi:hypothetical protein
MHNNSNVRRTTPPTKKKYISQGKYIYPNVTQHPKNNISAKKNILLLIDTLNTQSMSDSTYYYQSTSLSPSS